MAEYEDGRNYAGAADQWTAADNPAVELLDSTLYLGSPDPMDAVFTSLHIEQIARGGFWGRFDGSEGFSIVIDSAGRQLPPSAGYFCALRLD